MKSGAFANFRPLVKKLWWEVYGGCVYCGAALKVKEITIDHILPRQEYPEYKFDFMNCVPACQWCNTIRSDMPVEDFFAYIETPKYWQVRRKLITRASKPTKKGTKS